jgi:hypothetical protein
MIYPTQEYVKKLMDNGQWPAKQGEVLDIRSLDQKMITIIELYNQEEIIKQLTILNEKLSNAPQPIEAKRKTRASLKPPDKE